MYVPTLHLEVAPELGPLDVPTGGDWVDLTDRLMNFQLRRGRSDQFAKFTPATISATLDNSDRMLDPLNPDGLVPWDTDVGMPLCPVRAYITWGADDYPIAGRMFLGPEAWRCNDPDAGTAATVEFQAMDALGLFSGLTLTDGLWSQIVTGLIEPDVWIRGNTDGSWDNEMDAGATYGVQSGGTDYTYVPSLLPEQSGETDGIAWNFQSGRKLTVAEAVAFPAGTVNDSTFAIALRVGNSATAILGTPGDMEIAKVYDTGTSRTRWALEAIFTTGKFSLKSYNSSGTLINTITTDGNFVDLEAHCLAVVIDGGTRISLWVDGVRVGTSTSGPAQSYDGDLIIGGTMTAGFTRSYDELMFVKRAITDEEAEVLTGFVTHPATYRGESMQTRIERFYDIANWTLQTDEDDQWMPAKIALSPYYDYGPYGYVPLWGIGDLSGSVPKTLGEALQGVADGIGGDLYSLRNGMVRIRSILAVEDSTRANAFSTVWMHLTDEVSPTPIALPIPGEYAPVARRSQVQRTGSRLDRVINISDVSYGITDTGTNEVKSVTRRATDATSVARYGPRAVSQSLITQGGGMADAIGARTVARYAKPAIEFESVTLHLSAESFPVDLMNYLLSIIDLEIGVRVSYTPPGGGDVITRDTQVQGETWNWNPTTGLTVALDLAQS